MILATIWLGHPLLPVFSGPGRDLNLDVRAGGTMSYHHAFENVMSG